MNSIVAKILHHKGIKKYELLQKIYLISIIVVPLFFIIALYISKGSSFEIIINIISFILSITLICYSVLSLILRIDDKLISHKSGMKNNMFIATEASKLLKSKNTEKDLEWFYSYCLEVDIADSEIFSNLDEEERKRA